MRGNIFSLFNKYTLPNAPIRISPSCQYPRGLRRYIYIYIYIYFIEVGILPVSPKSKRVWLTNGLVCANPVLSCSRIPNGADSPHLIASHWLPLSSRVETLRE